MNKDYFQEIAKELEKKQPASTKKPGFPALKAYEYWVRYLKSHSNIPEPSQMIRVLPYSCAKKITENVNEALKFANLKELQMNFQKKEQEPKKEILENAEGPATNVTEEQDKPKLVENIATNSDNDLPAFNMRPRFRPRRMRNSYDDKETSMEYNCRQDAIEHLSKASEGGNMNQLVETYRQFLDGESICDRAVQSILQCSFIEEVTKIISKGVSERDPYLERIQTVQNTYHLSDTEMEFLIFSWIFYHEPRCEPLREFIGFPRRRDSNAAEYFSMFYNLSSKEIENITSQNGNLRRMLIINEDLDMLLKLLSFFQGKNGSNYAECFFQTCKEKAIPFEQLQENNPKAKLFRELLVHYRKGEPLNLFLHGVEGSGKTEFAKSIAQELGKDLVIIANENDATHKNNVNSPIINELLTGILLASDCYREKDALILVDEADLVLNGCEKGFLNSFLERLKVPVIWISNNIRMIERSTLRRFDYSMEFERMDADKRNSVWQSVIKAEHADKLLSPKRVAELSARIPVTAGGVTQAIRAAKALKKTDCPLDAAEIVKQMTTAQANLLGINLEYGDRDCATHAPRYSIDILNTDADMNRIHKVLKGFNDIWETMAEEDTPDSLNILLYGAPGTGKTEFARHIARELNHPIMIKRASDLLDKYVGESEKLIRAMFREAEERKAVLFLDEADSILRDRKGAETSWEVSHTNEILTQMENFKGIFIAATNFNESLDEASNRRFALKVKFDYLKPEAIEQIWPIYFPQVECPDDVKHISMLAPGDFSAVFKMLRFLPKEEITAEKIVDELKKEVSFKDDHCGRRLGL